MQIGCAKMSGIAMIRTASETEEKMNISVADLHDAPKDAHAEMKSASFAMSMLRPHRVRSARKMDAGAHFAIRGTLKVCGRSVTVAIVTVRDRIGR